MEPRLRFSEAIMTTSIELVEVGPRDGLQSEPSGLPTARKIELIERLVAAGVRRIEVASFVSPKRVPQMADAEQVLAGLQRRADVRYIGLVLNQKGFERAAAAGCNEVGMVVSATEAFNQRNNGTSREDSIAVWTAMAQAAHQTGIRPQVSISAAFGCPFEGELSIQHVVQLAMQLAAAEPCEIALADTIGAAVPTQVTALIARLRDALPNMPLRCHFHNTRNTGLANAFAALQAGVTTLDASVGGIGGCPFAPKATGNIPSEDLLYLCERTGYTTGISLDAMIQTSQWLEGELGHRVPGMLAKAGRFPRPAVQAG
jgi:hydroxymethylglutaryl-CoA lyase